MSIVVKIKFSFASRQNSIHTYLRTTISNYAELVQKIKKEAKCDDFYVTYEDELGDHCIIGSDETLWGAFKFTQKTNLNSCILRLNVQLKVDDLITMNKVVKNVPLKQEEEIKMKEHPVPVESVAIKKIEKI